MSMISYVRLGALAAAAATALVAAFPLWGEANAATTDHTVAVALAGHGHDRGDKRERHHRRDPHGSTCTITVPANPLSAAGLATPYVLNDGDATCNMTDGETAAFVEATIVDRAGTVSVYRPLVIDAGTTPAAAPTVPTLPAGATVGLWFGFQGDTLRLVGPGVGQGRCVNGLGTSLFGQFAYCNAPAFFFAARGVTAPALGTAADGMACPTTRDFFVVDQDQSDNVSTVYRVLPDGRTAQDNPAGVATGGVPLVNASDNGLLNRKINPALGCANFTAPDLTNPGGPAVPSLALNELSARQQKTPVALIPLNNPMTLVNGRQSLAKTDLYRLGTGQPLAFTRAQAAGTTYCNNLRTVFPMRLALNANRDTFTNPNGSPDPGVNLRDFLQGRFEASLTALGC